MVWKLLYNKRSYTIFNPPQRKNGSEISDGIPNKNPVIAGDTDAPTERAIPVIPDAADLSSGETTAIV